MARHVHAVTEVLGGVPAGVRPAGFLCVVRVSEERASVCIALRTCRSQEVSGFFIEVLTGGEL